MSLHKGDATKRLWALTLCLLLSGCGEDAPADKNLVQFSNRGVTIDRYYDTEHGVACYRYWGYGISCVKLKP